MSAPRAFPGEAVTALKWNELAECVFPQSASRSRPRLYDRLDPGDAAPSFWVYQEPVEPYHQRVLPGWICVEGGAPFLPIPMEEIHGCKVEDGKNVYLNLYIKTPEESTDPSTSPLLGGEYPPGSEASATVSTEPGEAKDGYTLTVITLSVWEPQIGSTPAGPQQHWASDIFITAKGSIIPTGGIPVYVRTRPETGWGPDENLAHNGLEVKDESTPDKWQYALALKHANESYSTEDIVPVGYQLGGVYKSYISGLDGAVPAQNKPTISYGQIIFPLANQGDEYTPNTYGLIYAARLVVDPESYSGSTYNEPRINKGVVEIPKGAGLEIGSENDPDRPPAYHYMTDAQLQTNGWIKVCSYGFNTGSETHDCYMVIRKGKLFFYMKPDGQISTEPS